MILTSIHILPMKKKYLLAFLSKKLLKFDSDGNIKIEKLRKCSMKVEQTPMLNSSLAEMKMMKKKTMKATKVPMKMLLQIRFNGRIH